MHGILKQMFIRSHSQDNTQGADATDNDNNDNNDNCDNCDNHNASDCGKFLQHKYDASREEIKELENKLDSQVSKYNRFSENNPMLGVSWCDDVKKWRVVHKSVSKTLKNKNDAIKTAEDNITKQEKKTIN